jgi:predicted HicB family RNase H-like nuclease
MQELFSVPKGKGRMKQERSQLNVRIPTTLKRQASAKAVLEGRDIGEVVETLLREYLDR